MAEMPKTIVETVVYLGQLTSVSLKPGDVLVLMVDEKVSDQTMCRIKEHMAGIPEFKGYNCVVLGNGMKLGIVSVQPGTTVMELPK